VEGTLADVTDDRAITVIVPFLNSLDHLRRTAPTVVAAARRTNGVEVVYVDNGSTDGSTEYLESLAPGLIRVLRLEHATIASMRNWGARQGRGFFLSFIDADCAIDEAYFDEAVSALDRSGADATGSEYALPAHPHWVEQALFDMHHIGRDRDVVYINAGNFFIRRSAFTAVGGFREDLLTGEDADIGQRLVTAGFRIYETPRVRAIHHGNPKSLRHHYRRTVWHGLGMFATVTRHRVDRPTVMLVVHLLLTIAGVIVVFIGGGDVWARLLIAVLLQLAVPATTVAFRVYQTRRWPSIAASLALYWVYYWARAHALALILLQREQQYRK